MRRSKIIIYALIIIYTIIVFFGIRELVINKSNISDRDESIENEDIEEETTSVYWRFEDAHEVGYWVAQKNGDWSDLPLTDVFREKYNEKDGVFGEMQFDKVEYMPYKEGKYPFEIYNYLVVTQGKKKTAYVFWLIPDMNDGFNDFEITHTYVLTDEDGKEIDYREGITENNFNSQMYILSDGDEMAETVGVTKKFQNKYPVFLDLFEHYSHIGFNRIEYVENKSSAFRKEAYFIVDSNLECKKRNYLVEFFLDSKGYIDDAIVHKINEIEYEGNNNYRNWKLFYNNSNWDGLEITANYKLKFKGLSYNNDIELIDINYITCGESVGNKKDNEYLRQCKMKNGETSIYYIKYIKDKKGYIDDIECRKLNYDNMDIEEALELYKKEYGDRQ